MAERERLREIRYNGDKVLVEAAKRDGKGNIIHEIYTKKSEFLAALEEIATTYFKNENVGSLITETELSNILASYSNTDVINEVLNSYVTTNALNSAVEDINTALGSYVTTTIFDNTITGLDNIYVAKSSLVDNSAEVGYVLTKTANGYGWQKGSVTGGITASLDPSTFVLTISLTDDEGNLISGASTTVDFPIETVVVNGSYNNSTKKLTLILKNGTSIEIPVSDLIGGLASTSSVETGLASKQDVIDSNNKLNSDLIDDTNSENKKFVTPNEKLQITTNKNDINDIKENYVSKQYLAEYVPQSSNNGSQSGNNDSQAAPAERKLVIDLTGKQYPYDEGSFMSLLFGDSIKEDGTLSRSIHFNIDPDSVSDIIDGLENIDLDNLPGKDSDEYYSESGEGMTMCGLPLVKVSYDHHESTAEILSLFILKAGSIIEQVDVTQNDFTFDPNLAYYTAETDPNNTDETIFVEVNTSEAIDPSKTYFSAFANDLIFLMSDLSPNGYPIFSNYEGNVMGLPVTLGWQDSFLNLLDEDGNFDLTQEVEEEREENGETHTEYTYPFEDYVGADISFVAESFNNVSMIFVSTPALLTDANQIKNCDAIELINGYVEGNSFPSMTLKKTSDVRIEMEFPVEDDTYYEMNSGFTEGDTFGSSITLYFDTESDPTTWLSGLTYHQTEHTAYILKVNYTSRSGDELNDIPLLVAGNMDGVYFLAVSLIGQSPNYIWASGTNQELGIDFVGWNLNEYGAYRLDLSEYEVATIEISYINPSENWNGEICGTYVGEEEEVSVPVLGEYMAAFNLTANRFMFRDYDFLTIGMFYASEEIADIPEVIEMMNQNEVSLIERGQDLTSEFNSISSRISNIESSYVTTSALSDELSKYSPDLSNYVTQNDISGFVTSNDLSSYVSSNDLNNILGDIATILDTINGENA